MIPRISFYCVANGEEPADNLPGVEVFVNQVGYLPDLPKLVVSAREAYEFTVIEEKTNLGPLSYSESSASYSSNEPAIDYNAPLVFLASAFIPPV